LFTWVYQDAVTELKLISPGTTSQLLNITTGSNLGSCGNGRGLFADALDVNNDGLGDVIFSCDSGAYLVYGTPSFLSLSISSTTEFTGLNGPLVAGVGDVDGDSFDDLLFSSGVTAVLIYGSGSLNASYNLLSLGGSDGVTFTSANTISSAGRAGDVCIHLLLLPILLFDEIHFVFVKR